MTSILPAPCHGPFPPQPSTKLLVRQDLSLRTAVDQALLLCLSPKKKKNREGGHWNKDPHRLGQGLEEDEGEGSQRLYEGFTGDTTTYTKTTSQLSAALLFVQGLSPAADATP